MASINKAIIIGRLGKDPQINTFTNGGKIASFTVATSKTWSDKTTGERKERTEWHNIVITNPKLAELAEKYLTKGSQVYIEGSIRTREYNDANGLKRQITEIVVAPIVGEIAFLDSKPKAAPAEYTPQPSEQAFNDDMDDDIPF
jgi:single-strand DNA-binding protein